MLITAGRVVLTHKHEIFLLATPMLNHWDLQCRAHKFAVVRSKEKTRERGCQAH